MTQNQNQHNYVIRIPLSTSKLLNEKIKNYQIKIMSNSAHLKNHKVMELGIDLVSLYIEENPTELVQVKEFHLIKLTTMKTVACFTKKSNCLDYENLNEQIKNFKII